MGSSVATSPGCAAFKESEEHSTTHLEARDKGRVWRVQRLRIGRPSATRRGKKMEPCTASKNSEAKIPL